MKEVKKLAGIYIRVTTLNQVRRTIKRKGYEIYKVYVDEGIIVKNEQKTII